MIESFGDSRTRDIYEGRAGKGFPAAVVPVACRKLDMLNRAQTLRDLLAPPGNRLEALKGDMKGFHSIRINAQWRVVFIWTDGTAREVRIVDYH